MVMKILLKNKYGAINKVKRYGMLIGLGILVLIVLGIIALIIWIKNNKGKGEA